MKLQKTYISLLVKNLSISEEWYTKLLGRHPDNRPMDSLVQREISEQSGLAICTDDEIANKGAIFIYVEDVEAERDRLQNLGIVLGENIQGDYSTLAQIVDPDGNLLTLATPPSPSFPPA